MHTGVIYCATSPSHKKYYGQTFHDFESRKGRHFLEAIKRDCQYAFHRAIRKYGFDNFAWEIIEEYSFEFEDELINKLNEREIYWIEKDKTYLPEFGYNMKIGGFNGRHGQETKDKIRKKLTGVKHSEERKRHESESHIGQIAWNKNKECPQFSGEKNGMHGISVYDLWVKKYGVEEADKRKEARRINLSNSLQGKNKGKPSMYDVWVKKYGVEEADKLKEARKIKLSKSLTGKKKNKRKIEESFDENNMGNSESQLISYMKQIAAMTQGRQQEFFQWKVDNAVSLSHVKTDEIRKQYPKINDYLKRHHVVVTQKECYKNAGQLCLAIPGVDYVEGEISYHGIPIEHAWNKIDGKYFDITKDILFPDDEDYSEYVKIIELPQKEYRQFILKYKHWGGFISAKYKKDHKMNESFYPRLVEDVLDKAREKMFNVRSNEPEQIEERDKVVAIGKSEYNNKVNISIIKNPSNVKNIAEDIRGVIDKEGNLYTPSSTLITHTGIIYALVKAGIIEPQDHWWNKIPEHFITVQRTYSEGYEDIFLLGESNDSLNNEDEKYREKWNLPSIEEARKVFVSYIEKAKEKNPNFEFYAYTRSNLYDNPDIREKIFESSAIDKYYEKNFGITYGYENPTDAYNVVAKVGKYRTPIILNPKSLDGFDAGVRAISDKDGNLYVAMHQKYFNHGTMANALIDAGLIDTVKYNEEAAKVSEVEGIYDDQKNFFLLERFDDEWTFIPSDTFEWEGTYSEIILDNLKHKNPQFKFDMDHEFDEIGDELED